MKILYLLSNISGFGTGVAILVSGRKTDSNGVTMTKQIKEDMHIHSTFSDGINSIEENIAEAERVGLERICCVDHVRESTDWVAEFAAAVAETRKTARLKIFSGVETKILDTSGKLDMPDSIDGIDFIYAADHQFPLADGPHHPKEIRRMLADEIATKHELIGELIKAVANTLERYPNVVLAHLFSVLPKAGMSEYDVALKDLEMLAAKAKRRGAMIEVDERWKCPTLRTVTIFRDHGVPVIFSSDSHRREKIGRYIYNRKIYEALSKPNGGRDLWKRQS